MTYARWSGVSPARAGFVSGWSAHAAASASSATTGTSRPALFDAAYLTTRYKSEYDLAELPGFVKKVLIPATYYVGKLLGKYKHFEGAPEPVRE